VQAIKDNITEAGVGIYTKEEIDAIGTKCLELVEKSLQRIKENDDMKKEEPEDEDDKLDQDDLALLKEENQNEHDLQVSLAELMGALFKTHKDFVGQLVSELTTKVIPAAFSSSEQKRYKFAIFILDDMIEHLGPTYFADADW